MLEELTSVRGATEKVQKRHRYELVSWAYYQLRQMIEYKAAKAQSKVMAVDPHYTSQACPKCGHTEKGHHHKNIIGLRVRTAIIGPMMTALVE